MILLDDIKDVWLSPRETGNKTAVFKIKKKISTFQREIKSSFYKLREVTIGLLPPEAIKVLKTLAV